MPSSLNFFINIMYLLVMIRAVCSNGDDDSARCLTYVDENGTSHELNFSELPTDGRGWKYGRIYFHLYTRNNTLEPEFLNIPSNGNKLNSKFFNVSNDIKVHAHGWLSSGHTPWILDMKDQYLNRSDVNVIIVDWSELARNPVYPWSALSTRYVGKRLAKLLNSLVSSYTAKGENMHLIGHSLGAHVMGYAGMFFNDDIRRITGLDPARPLFELPPMDDAFRLDKSDAKFVDIIHTCGGVFGYEYSHGQADYYPNSGKPSQPGCNGWKALINSCSHGRSYEYFIESIRSIVPFTSYRSESYKEFENGNKNGTSLMGDPANETSSGDFYLHTKNQSTYAKEDEQ